MHLPFAPSNEILASITHEDEQLAAQVSPEDGLLPVKEGYTEADLKRERAAVADLMRAHLGLPATANKIHFGWAVFRAPDSARNEMLELITEKRAALRRSRQRVETVLAA